MTEPSVVIPRSPFLLNFVSKGIDTSNLEVIYSEIEELSILVGEGVPVASTRYLLATQTKTSERKETDDPDL